jgi:hypothetical protein
MSQPANTGVADDAHQAAFTISAQVGKSALAAWGAVSRGSPPVVYKDVRVLRPAKAYHHDSPNSIRTGAIGG